jgi:hypothetical protein
VALLERSPSEFIPVLNRKFERAAHSSAADCEVSRNGAGNPVETEDLPVSLLLGVAEANIVKPEVGKAV